MIGHPWHVVSRGSFEIDDIHHLTVYVVGGRQNLLDAWEVVRECFVESVPPATLLGVSDLRYENQLVEIDATVVRS
jgi:hypothetical protein